MRHDVRTIFGASLSEPHTSHVSGAFSLNVCMYEISYVRRAAYSMFCNLTLCNLILQFQFLAFPLHVRTKHVAKPLNCRCFSSAMDESCSAERE